MTDLLECEIPGNNFGHEAGSHHTILSLTSSSEESYLTRAQAHLLFSLHRRPIPASSLLFFDTISKQHSSINPPDDNTLGSLSLVFIKKLLGKRLLSLKTTPSGRWLTHINFFEQVHPAVSVLNGLTIRPASHRNSLRACLKNGSIIRQSPVEKTAAEISMTADVCPRCFLLIHAGKSCPDHPGSVSRQRLQLRISRSLQRLIWLACKISAPFESAHNRHFSPLATLLVDPRLLQNELVLFIGFLLQLNPQLPFKEIIVWPKSPFKERGVEATTNEAFNVEHKLAMLWPGWNSLTTPPEGRILFIRKLKQKWKYLKRLVNARPSKPFQATGSDAGAMQLDRWLLHSLNLMVAGFLADEEQRRSAQALEKLARFIRIQLINVYVLRRKHDWDQPAQNTLKTAISTLEALSAPYGLISNRDALLTAKAVPIRLYREDWIFPKEFKLIETALQICRSISTLEREVKRAGLALQERISIRMPQLRTFPKELLHVLHRIRPESTVDFAVDSVRKSVPELKTQTGPWRISIPIDDPGSCNHLLRFYQEQLEKDQASYEQYKTLYSVHSSRPGASQTHLKSMRKKLLQLKRRQMISLSRKHELL